MFVQKMLNSESNKIVYNRNTLKNMDLNIGESDTALIKYSNSDLLKQIKLKDYIKDIYISEFSTEWERNILDLIPSGDRRKHSSFINLVLDEVKEIYVESMKDFTLGSILSCKIYKRKYTVCEECDPPPGQKQNILGDYTTYNRSIFLKRRCSLTKRYYLAHPIIRHIMNAAHCILPTVICDFRQYHEIGMLTLHNFQDMVLKDIKRGALMITNKFYTETFKAVQNSKTLRSMSVKRLLQLMKCLTNVFVQQILGVMMRSIDHIINTMRDARSCPQIGFQLTCKDDQLVTQPDVEEVFSAYHHIIRSIEDIAQDLMPLEEWLDIKAEVKYIKVTLPEWFVEESHRNLQDILDALFQPMNEHVALVSEGFGGVCATSSRNRIRSLTSRQPNFDLYLTYIHKYKEYLSKTNSILSNLYYSVGRLEQISAKESLRRICYDVINVLTTELVKYHQDINRSICSDFEELKSTALDIPKDAESLIQLSEYMSHALKVSMKEQEQQIQQSIYMLCKLSDIAVLSDEHVALNQTAVKWLRDIQPVFAQNNTLCEAMKSELEEELQRRINTLNSQVDAMFPQLVILDNMDDVSRVGEYVEHYKDLIKKYDRINDEMQVINSEERLFKFPETEFPKITELKETIVPFYTLICTVHQWQRDNSVWLNGPFECLDASVIERKTVSYFDEVTEISKTMKARIKMDATANKSYKFIGIADDPDPMQQPAPLKLCWQALNNVNEFKVYLPLAVCMCNPALEARHWREMSAICNFDLTPNAGTTLRKMIDMNLMDNIDKYKAVSLGANKELRLQQELAEMIEQWQPVSFEMSSDPRTGTVIFEHVDEIETLLRDHIIKIEEMRASHFVKPILSDVLDFSAVLLRIQESLDQWTRIQHRKLPLDLIFSYPGIATRLDPEATLYLEATGALRDVNDGFAKDPSYRRIKESTDLLEILGRANEKLERAARRVEDYLELKKLSFPRFFFLEHSEIRRILFESDAARRHAVVKKCFSGIERLKLTKSNRIQCVIGLYGESLRLRSSIPISTDTEREEYWLVQLEKETISAVRESILQYYPTVDENPTPTFTDNVPSGTIVCGLQLHWTSSVEESLASPNAAKLQSLSTRYANWIASMTNELRNNLTRRCRSLLTSLIIIVSVHEEIVRLLLEKSVTKSSDFEWTAQLRYYLRDEVIEVSIFNATMEYGYEYNHYHQNIVNTPLTDRCFRAVMQAYRYHLYSSIIGPTGSGKTETIRSLTSAFAKPFYTVNCHPDVPYECVSQALKGAVSCGAWICLENFDRLKLELLSALAQNLTLMKQTVSSKLRTVDLDGCTLNLNASGNVCITVNTERSGYTDLPSNLRVLFRPVSMMVPDVGRIAEIKLFAGGFLHARDLAAKLAVTYRLLSQQLEERKRYNLGLSSLKAVIETAIGMKQGLPEENEYTLVLRSTIDINIPQFLSVDVLTFQDVARDIFPENLTLPFDHSAILNALKEVCARRCLTLHRVFLLKAIQIIELMCVRRAFILVGEPLGGKTAILNALAETLSLLRDQKSKIGATVKLETVLPGVVDSDELFGHLCAETKTWQDGLCTAVLRRFTEDTSTDRKWLVFDGALSGAWIESLYAALDENKTLHLASGERLPVAESTSVIFETASLVGVSPGVISRCGIVHIDAPSIGWRPYAASHLARHDVYTGYEKVLNDLLDWTIDPCLDFLRESAGTPVNRELHLVGATLNLLEMLLKDARDDNAEDTGKDSHFVVWAQAALISAVAWGLAGDLIGDSQTRFNAFWTSFWNGTNAKRPKPDSVRHLDVTLPSEGLIQDNFYVFKGLGGWRYCGDSLKNEKIPEAYNFHEIYIPTVDSMKYQRVFSRHIRHRKPFLVYGDVAVGKSCMLRDLLSNRLPANCQANFFSLAAMVNVSRTRSLLLSKLNKIRRASYGPGSNRYCVNFVDDVNVARRPETRPVLELLRQLLSYGYCYDASESTKIFVRDITFALAITKGKNHGDVDLPPRFSRHFNTYTIPAPTAENVFRVYSNTLLANLKKNLFAADVTGNVNSMVNATLDVYRSVTKTFRPVPSKLYYFFDMRDVSRVIHGCSLIQRESVETKITFIRLWVHEILRVFGDRISDEGDKVWLFLRIREAVKGNFKDSFELAFDHLPKFENGKITKDSFGDFMFGNLMDTEKSDRGRRYEEISSVETLRGKVLAYLEEYNASARRKRLDVVLSNYMLKSLIKLSRILSTPGGNVLMISAIGSGRKSTAALAAFVQQQSLFETSAESYRDADAWRTDLRKVLRECGALRKDATYFMSERQIKDEFLCDIGCLLSTGDLPDLFSAEDRQGIIEMTRLHAQGGDRNAELSARSVMLHFVEQCRNRLHFVLCFSPTNAAFRTYLCSHPNLAKHCTVNIYEEWPDQALLEIAVKHMKHVNVQEEMKARAAKTCVRFHDSGKRMSSRYRETFDRTIHVTSSAFLHMLKLYTRLMSRKQEEIVATRNKYVAGLEKLELAADQVEQMKNTLTILKPQLELSAQQTVITMKEVENENVTVERATIVVKQEEEIANKKAEIAGTLKSECEADLAVAIPILEDALVALNTLKPTDITLVKAMKNPPDTIKLVMAAVCVMLGVSPDRTIDPATGKKHTDFWGPSKRILGDMNFLQNLKDYDKDDIAPAVMQVIKKTYMTDNSFMPHIVAKASSAAEGLCKWVRAMVSYDEVAKVVAPKKKKLAEAQTECDEAEAFLNEKRQTLAALNAKLATLHDSLRQTLQKKLSLETEVATCTAKLIKAEKLIASLGGEKSRWMECARDLQLNYDSLVGDMLLSCGIVAYTASYNISFRDEILTEWKKIVETAGIPYTKAYNFVSVLGVEIEINHWQLCGLSKNRFAVENAVILNNSEQWCLFIDSQNQINQWIKRIEQRNYLKVVKLTDADCTAAIVRNIEAGRPVLLENVGERLEIALEPILSKDIYKNDDWYIDIAGKSVRYSPDFRLYITTRLSNPTYSADVFSKLTIIDFSMPDGTLRDKLLDIVVSKERPELQEKFEMLRIQDAINKKVLQQQEDNILITLSSTTTNILEDEKAMRTLDSSKTLTVDIMRRQEAARATVKSINEFRDAYLRFADHCAELFCTLNTLSNLNHMYRFSFTWFIQLYITSIETSSRSVILEKRLQFLKSSFTKNLHSSVCRSLLERHKLLYSFLLCVKVLIDSEQITREEVKCFTDCESSSEDPGDDDTTSKEAPEWLPPSTWRRIRALSSRLADLSELASDFLSNGVAWERYCRAVPFRGHSLPTPWSNGLTRFQRLLIVKAIRRDKIIVEIMRLVEDTMEDVFNSYPHLQISESYAESSCFTPILFILPSYDSPLALISAYASARGYTSKFVSLSIGDGRLGEAEVLVERARRDGGWVLLQNCHHATGWIPRLERICEDLCLSATSLDFRLWLSSRSTPDFPISILQSSVKIAHDRPLRLKQCLLRAYRSEPVGCKEFFEGCPGKDKEFSKLLYGLCFFHGVVRERRHFGPQGWVLPYDFDQVDFELSARQLQDLINDHDSVPFDTLRYFVGDCNYAGKILHDLDRRCLGYLLDSFCNARVIGSAERSFIGGHRVPRRCEYRDIVKDIRDMQLDAVPEVFAVDENALVTRDAAAANEFMLSMSLLDRTGPPDRETGTGDLLQEAIDEINDKLPASLNIQEIRRKYPFTSREPFNAILVREAELINEIVATIAGSLSRLRLALNGDVVMDDRLEGLSEEIRSNQVPRIWRTIDVGIATGRLSMYISLLAKRVDFVRDWSDNGPPRVVHFDLLFSRRRFLSAALLAFSRRHGVPVERVASILKVARDAGDETNTDTYYIRGLHLFGARWDTRRYALAESLTNVFSCEMPPVRLTFGVDEATIDDDVYECPVYVSPNRRPEDGNVIETWDRRVTSVPLETDVSPIHWVKRGTALFCQVDV